jgi:hypothetical protein
LVGSLGNVWNGGSMNTIPHEKREQAIATLIKAAIDAAVALDELKRHGSDPDGDRMIIERVFSACEAVQS